MSNLVIVERRDQVLVVLINNPPVNALSQGVPEGIEKGDPERSRRLTELVDIFDRFAK